MNLEDIANREQKLTELEQRIRASLKSNPSLSKDLEGFFLLLQFNQTAQLTEYINGFERDKAIGFVHCINQLLTRLLMAKPKEKEIFL